MSNPAKRSFVSEHGKELNLYPDQMGFVGGARGNILLSDQTGISLTTEKKIQIIGKSVFFEAPKVSAAAPASELLLCKGDAITGQPIGSLIMSNQFDLKIVNQSIAMGSNEQTFAAYDDAFKEVEQELLSSNRRGESKKC